MDIELGQNETIIESWDYSENGPYSLIVTNKRLIHLELYSDYINRKDFAIKDISGIEISNYINPLNIFLIVLGVLFIIGGIIGSILLHLAMLLLCFFGLGLIVGAFLAKRAVAFSLVIYTNSRPLPVIGVVTNKFKASNNAIKINLNKELMEDIISTLPKIILGD